MYLLHLKNNDIYANIGLFLSYSEVTVATRSSPYPDQMITAVTRSSPYPDQMITAVNGSSPYPDQMITAVTGSSPYPDQMITAVTGSSPYPDQMITAVTGSSPYPDQMITAVTGSSPYPDQMITAVTGSSPYPDQMITAVTGSSPYPDQMITAVTGSSPYPDQMVDQHLETTSTALSVSGDQGTKMSPRDRSQRRPRHLDSHREKINGTSGALTIWLCCSWNKLLVRLAGGELAPRLSLVSPKVFSPFCHRWSLGSLPLSPLACLVGDTSFPAIYHRLDSTDTI